MFNANTMPPWERLEDGMELGLFPACFSAGSPFTIVILRIDPTRLDLTIETSSGGGKPRSLREWAAEKDLIAVINASMYLPDGQKSTGYLRSGDIINNERIVSKFGAFFVCNPDDPSLPSADVLDRSNKDWESRLPHYRMAAQNYRLINAARHLLWKPGGPQHSISAVGQDGTGKILFIHCREPITGVDFGKLLLSLPADIRLVMYTEGGTQAGLLVQTATRNQIWMGRHFADFWTDGNEKSPLPNVIGVRRRNR